jgi:hypothetical protein
MVPTNMEREYRGFSMFTYDVLVVIAVIMVWVKMLYIQDVLSKALEMR